MALGTLLHGVSAIALGVDGWNLIGMRILIGEIVLTYLPELLFRKYWGR